MGGLGSGERYGQYVKTTVEECDGLDINWMIREGMFDSCKPSSGIYTITGSGDYISSYNYLLKPDSQQLDLQYRFKDDVIAYSIRLSTTRLPWGGKRWWLHCPLILNGEPCLSRIAKLWCPRFSKYFGCRRCHDLTYFLCQRSHKNDDGYRGKDAPRHWPMIERIRHDILEDYKEGKKYAQASVRADQRKVRRKAKRWS